jgi:hypothetical protein
MIKLANIARHLLLKNVTEKDVESLFESNPELANQVYEVLGIKPKLELNSNYITNLKLGGFNKYIQVATYDLEKEAVNMNVTLGIPFPGMPVPFKSFENIQSAFQYILRSSLPNRLDKESLLELRKLYLKKILNVDDKQLALNAIDYLISILPDKKITLQQKQRAIERYTKYLQQYPDGIKVMHLLDIEGFKKFVQND